MPSITVVPPDSSARTGYTAVREAFGPGAPGTLQVITPAADLQPPRAYSRQTPASPRVMPAQPAADNSGLALIQAVPAADPSDPALKPPSPHCAEQLPAGAQVGGAAVENLDLQAAAGRQDATRPRRDPAARVRAAGVRVASTAAARSSAPSPTCWPPAPRSARPG